MADYDYGDYDYDYGDYDYGDYGYGDSPLVDYSGFTVPGGSSTYDYGDYGYGDSPLVASPGFTVPGGSSTSNIPSWLRNAASKLFSGNSGGAGLTTGQGIMGLLAALAAYKDRAGPSGGGSSQGYAGPKDPGRTMVAGKYGPQASYTTPPVRAATGGPLYAQGGPVQLEHGGFVMTKRAVDGAGGPQGITQLAPGARMIRGPGTGTSDSIPAQINGPRGQTPALVSNGEAYVPRQAVQSAGGIPRLMATMKQLERKA